MHTALRMVQGGRGFAWLPQELVRPLVAAGLLVGIGTRYGAGCTSGHGVCGISRAEIGGAGLAPAVTDAVPWEAVPQLVVGLELATARLAVASLGLEPFAATQGVGHA